MLPSTTLRPNRDHILLNPITLNTSIHSLSLRLIVTTISRPSTLFTPLMLLVLTIRRLIRNNGLTIRHHLPRLLILSHRSRRTTSIRRHTSMMSTRIRLTITRGRRVTRHRSRHHRSSNRRNHFSTSSSVTLKAFILVLRRPSTTRGTTVSPRRGRR